MALTVSASAGNWIKATIVVTNGTTNGFTVTFNGTLRTWTNSVFTPSTMILTNAVAATAATNLFNHLSLYKPSGTILDNRPNPTNIILEGQDLTASISAGWAVLTLTTNTQVANYVVAVPFSNMGATNRTNIASLLTLDLNTYSQIGIDQDSTLASELAGLAKNQTFDAGFLSTHHETNIFDNVSNRFAGFFAGVPTLTNGSWTNATLSSPKMTNGVNYGNSFNSVGSGANSSMFGSDATASGDFSLAVGFEPGASGNYAIGIGYQNDASGTASIAIGSTVTASGANAIAIGQDTIADKTSAVAIGDAALAQFINSAAFGASAEATTSNQIMLGSSTVDYVTTFGRFEALGGITNPMFTGLLTNSADTAFTRTNNTSLANGNNANVDASGKEYIKVSGPSAAFSINGIRGGRDGRQLTIENATGFTMTLENDSGVDPVAANRIYTGNNAGVGNTNTPGMFLLRYDSALSRWVLINQVGTASVGVTSVAMTVPSILSVAGSPITSSGTLAVTLATETANTVFAGGTSGGAATPTFRLLVLADLPSMTSSEFATKISDETGSGLVVFNSAPTFTLPILASNTGPQTAIAGQYGFDLNAHAAAHGAVQVNDGTINTWLVGVVTNDAPSNGQVPTWNTGGTITWETPSAGGTPAFNNTQFASAGGTTNMKSGVLLTNVLMETSTNNGDFVATGDLSANSFSVGGGFISGTAGGTLSSENFNNAMAFSSDGGTFLSDGSGNVEANILSASTYVSFPSNVNAFSLVTNFPGLNTWVTNGTGRLWVQAGFTLTSAVGDPAKVTLLIIQGGGITNRITCDKALGVTTANTGNVFSFVQPNASFIFTNLSTGLATAAFVADSYQYVPQ